MKNIKISRKIHIEALNKLEHKAYWVIDHLSSDKRDRFSSTEIANFLIEDIGINTSRQAIEAALQRSKVDCNKNKHGYKLMQNGRDELLKVIIPQKQKVVFINANEPFSAKNFTIKEILGETHKEVSICDPYIDSNTLDVIYKAFKKGAPIRLLTSKIIDKPAGSFKRQVADLLTEGYKIEVRVYSKSELHDRYIIDENNIWFSGNSLNYLGKKESFIILLGQDIRKSILSTFNNHWKAGVFFK